MENKPHLGKRFEEAFNALSVQEKNHIMPKVLLAYGQWLINTSKDVNFYKRDIVDWESEWSPPGKAHYS